jgi:cAMP-specific phosphodiesterase 4
MIQDTLSAKDGNVFDCIEALKTNSGSGSFSTRRDSDTGPACGMGGGSAGNLVGIPLKMCTLINSWEGFDTLKLAAELHAEIGSPTGILAQTVDIVMCRFDILGGLHVSKRRFSKFLVSLEAEYGMPDYHTAVHAADVVQAVGFMLSEGLYDQISDLHAFALVVAAAAHDVGHPGLNNAFLISTESNEAQRWNEVSVNENGHLYTVLGLLQRHKVLESFTPADKQSFKAMLRRLVLHTDMEKHSQLITDFVAMATETIAATATAAAEGASDTEVDHGDASSKGNGDAEVESAGGVAPLLGHGGVARKAKSVTMMGLIRGPSAENLGAPPVRDWVDPGLALCYVLHCADISNPARPFALAHRWGEKITEEFYKQGDKERELGIRVLAFYDRRLAKPGTVAANQGNFIDFVCTPTFEALTTMLPAAAGLMLYHLRLNREKYKAIADQAEAERRSGGGR